MSGTIRGDLKYAFESKNLKKAWHWIKTSNDAFYKQYFRHTYRSFSLAENELLDSLSKKLKNNLYSPSFSTKIYLPKRSGILRPITLLSIEDQIVYQALANIIATKMYRKNSEIAKNAEKVFFGNVFGGSNSFSFYRDWRIGYTKFQNKFEDGFNLGLEYTASFDLTACYDSISYMVLRHQLLKFGLDEEFCQKLIELLTKWSSFERLPNPIFHGHGIPQGPLSSGILAESVLCAFDDISEKSRNVAYLRYVDDIRILAQDEKTLRVNLMKMDLKSKSLGLFPQSSKIDIHKIKDIGQEIKQIEFSKNEGHTFDITRKEERDVVKKIIAITPKFIVKSETEFKYLLSKVKPKHSLQKRLIKILKKSPHLYVSILNCYSKLPRFSKNVSIELFELLKEEQLYYSYQAKFMTLLRDRIDSSFKKKLVNYCKRRIGNYEYKNDAEYRTAVNSVVIKNNSLVYTELRNIICNETNWWARGKNICYLVDTHIGKPSLSEILENIAKSTSVDAAILGVELILEHELSYSTTKIKSFNESSQVILKKKRQVQKIYENKCMISNSLAEMIDLDRNVKWKKILNSKYELVLRKSLRWLGYGKSDASAWTSLTDTINDIVLDQLMKKDNTIGTPPGIGRMGSALNAPTGKLAKKYPKFYFAAKEVHKMRLMCDLSHSQLKGSGKYTRFISFKEMKKMKKILKEGYEEIWTLFFKST